MINYHLFKYFEFEYKIKNNYKIIVSFDYIFGIKSKLKKTIKYKTIL